MGRRWIVTGLPKGTADVIGWAHVDGRATWVSIEVKAPEGGRLSKEQREHLEEIRDAGGIAGVVTGLDECRELLAGAGVELM